MSRARRSTKGGEDPPSNQPPRERARSVPTRRRRFSAADIPSSGLGNSRSDRCGGTTPPPERRRSSRGQAEEPASPPEVARSTKRPSAAQRRRSGGAGNSPPEQPSSGLGSSKTDRFGATASPTGQRSSSPAQTEEPAPPPAIARSKNNKYLLPFVEVKMNQMSGQNNRVPKLRKDDKKRMREWHGKEVDIIWNMDSELRRKALALCGDE